MQVIKILTWVIITIVVIKKEIPQNYLKLRMVVVLIYQILKMMLLAINNSGAVNVANTLGAGNTTVTGTLDVSALAVWMVVLMLMVLLLLLIPWQCIYYWYSWCWCHNRNWYS